MDTHRLSHEQRAASTGLLTTLANHHEACQQQAYRLSSGPPYRRRAEGAFSVGEEHQCLKPQPSRHLEEEDRTAGEAATTVRTTSQTSPADCLSFSISYSDLSLSLHLIFFDLSLSHLLGVVAMRGM